MRIDSSAIGMESNRTYVSVTARAARFTSIKAGRGEIESGMGNLLGNLFNTEENAKEAGEAAEGENASANLEDLTAHFKNLSNMGRVTSSREEKNALHTIRQQSMKFLMELLFWRRERRMEDYNFLSGSIDMSNLQPAPVVRINAVTNQYYHSEEESTNFSTKGLVKTADGREISFNLEFGMSRRFEEYYEETYAAQITDYCDPLVINLDTNVAQVSDQKFFFDLDCDGEEDEISTLKSGSGFLALDLNGDGAVNDGSELFGTKSGDGFQDLAKYDSDSNGWIDEGDPIWDKLLIWTKDDEGNDALYHLSDLGVGAIGLANVSTQFSLNSEQDNQTNAMVRNTGIFLYENGGVSTVQHLDLAR